jgi:hypothetical protein
VVKDPPAVQGDSNVGWKANILVFNCYEVKDGFDRVRGSNPDRGPRRSRLAGSLPSGWNWSKGAGRLGSSKND